MESIDTKVLQFEMHEDHRVIENNPHPGDSRDAVCVLKFNRICKKKIQIQNRREMPEALAAECGSNFCSDSYNNISGPV